MGGLASSHIRGLAVQSDGKVVGDFTEVNGATHSGVARLNANGTIDSSYTPDLNYPVTRAVAIQPDDKAIITGMFGAIGGVWRPTIARLNTDSTLDTSFATGGTSIGTGILAFGASTLALQGNGKVIVGDDFTNAGGTDVNALARLNADGSLDTTFSAGAPSGAEVQAIAIDGSGNVLVGGTFATMAGRGTVNIAGGSFVNVNSAAAPHLARFTRAGVSDASFTASATINAPVLDLEVQALADVVIGGAFTAIPKLARVDGGATIPGAPTGITATAGDGSATVSWSAPADTGGFPVTGYTVTRIPGGSCTSVTTSRTVTGLTRGTPYTFVVRATNAVGTSADSGPSAPVTPPAPPASAAPGGGAQSGAGGAGTGMGMDSGTPAVASLTAWWRISGVRAAGTITPHVGATGYALTAVRAGAPGYLPPSQVGEGRARVVHHHARQRHVDADRGGPLGNHAHRPYHPQRHDEVTTGTSTTPHARLPPGPGAARPPRIARSDAIPRPPSEVSVVQRPPAPAYRRALPR